MRFNTRIRRGAPVVNIEYACGRTASARVDGVKGKKLTLKLKTTSGGSGRVETAASAGSLSMGSAGVSAPRGAIKSIMFKNLGETPEEMAAKALINKASQSL